MGSVSLCSVWLALNFGLSIHSYLAVLMEYSGPARQAGWRWTVFALASFEQAPPWLFSFVVCHCLDPLFDLHLYLHQAQSLLIHR